MYAINRLPVNEGYSQSQLRKPQFSKEMLNALDRIERRIAGVENFEQSRRCRNATSETGEKEITGDVGICSTS
jgi:hypothetical protein